MAMHQGLDDGTNDMFLSSDLLFDLKSSGDSSPCFVFHRLCKASSDSGLERTGLNIETESPRILSYSSFKKCLVLHEEWLKHTVKVATTRCAKDREISHHKSSMSSSHLIDDIVIAYISGNSPNFLLSVLACSSPGLKPSIPALLNIRWTPSEMISSLQSSMQNKNNQSKRNAITIVLHDDSIPSRDAARQVSNGLRETNNQFTCHLPIPDFTHSYSQTINRFSGRSNNQTLIENKFANELHQRIKTCIAKASKSDALILFTSGTTGGFKGVRLSHRALLVQALAKLDEPTRYSAETTMMSTTVPLFHVGGFSSFLAVLLARGQLVFQQRDGGSGKFQVQHISKSLEDPYLPVNTLVVVPAMLSSFFDLENKTGRKRKQYPQAQLILIGGQSPSEEIIKQSCYCFPNARIVQTFACTEAASSMTFLSLAKGSAKLVDSVVTMGEVSGSCVGCPPQHVQLRIYGRKRTIKTTPALVEYELKTKPYEIGQIATNGPQVMNGYWQRGKQRNNGSLESRTAHDNHDRWFISSDLGFWDERGRLFFAGRTKDVVRTGGETVLAPEVERVLLSHPIIAECAIFPRLDDKYGEVVACAIVTKASQDDGVLTIQTVKKWCEEKGLAGYKQPKFLVFVSTLPRNSSGKVLKHKIVAKFGNNKSQSKL